MSYKATAKEYELQVTDKEGLLKVLNEQLSEVQHSDYPYESLEDALRFFCYSADQITIDSQGHVDGLLVYYMNYHEEDWETIAPYLSGYIEWAGEDDCVWRDYFRNGRMEPETPEVIWPSESFYIERWNDTDVVPQICDFDIAEDDSIFNEILDEAKLRITRCFDDKSYRNEQIKQIIADILHERSRKNEDNS